MLENINPLLLIDGYKLDHRRQYPEGTEVVYSNWTPRSTRVPGVTSVVFFGLQYFIMEYIERRFDVGFFFRDREEVLREYDNFMLNYLGPNNIGVEHIGALHDLGYLPLEFCALPEGSYCPIGVPPVTVMNTLPEFFWLTNYIETMMSFVLWKPLTSATTAREMRKLLESNCTGDRDFIDYQGHDFSLRGMSGLEDACMSGAGHLLFFKGTDTIPAIEFIKQYYYGRDGAGVSVPATEHSVVCAGGETNELGTLGRILDLYPSGVVSYVSDTWNLWDVLTVLLPQLKSKVLARDGKLVIRPDSGDPVKIICGDPDASDPRARRGVVQLLWDLFGGTVGPNGYKTLDSHIGVIYGDSINPERARAILGGLRDAGFASDNIVFGIGSYTYECVTRDTHGLAMKATFARIKGVGHNLFKRPVTDNGDKFSACGLLAVLDSDSGRRELVQDANGDEMAMSQLRPVWSDGAWCRRPAIFEEVRDRARAEMWR